MYWWEMVYFAACFAGGWDTAQDLAGAATALSSLPSSHSSSLSLLYLSGHSPISCTSLALRPQHPMFAPPPSRRSLLPLSTVGSSESHKRSSCQVVLKVCSTRPVFARGRVIPIFVHAFKSSWTALWALSDIAKNLCQNSKALFWDLINEVNEVSVVVTSHARNTCVRRPYTHSA
jgi:hypothetical protein